MDSTKMQRKCLTAGAALSQCISEPASTRSSESAQSTIAAFSADAPSPVQTCQLPASPIRFSNVTEHAPAQLLPHETAASLFDTLTQMHEEAIELEYAKERFRMRLMLEAECQRGEEDSACERLLRAEDPDERRLCSQHELYIEEADPVGLGTRCQVASIPVCGAQWSASEFRGELLFDPERIQAEALDSYLRAIRSMWPQEFEYREEVALQFLAERLNYAGISQGAECNVAAVLRAFLNDLRVSNRSHATISVFQRVGARHTIKQVISPIQNYLEQRFLKCAASRTKQAR